MTPTLVPSVSVKTEQDAYLAALYLEAICVLEKFSMGTHTDVPT